VAARENELRTPGVLRGRRLPAGLGILEREEIGKRGIDPAVGRERRLTGRRRQMARKRLCCVLTTGLFGLAAFGPTAANAQQAPSCTGQFVMSVAPQSAGAFGAFARNAAQTADPNLGIGDISPEARSDHSACG
jgi:hypothetical protein